MSILVLDASVALRWILEGDTPPLAHRVRDALSLPSTLAIVPSLWHWEVANSLIVAERRKAAIPGGFDVVWAKAVNWFAVVETDQRPANAIDAALQLARQNALTVYDAAYLELAIRRNAPLATLDGQLRRAAPKAGVMVDF